MESVWIRTLEASYVIFQVVPYFYTSLLTT